MAVNKPKGRKRWRIDITHEETRYRINSPENTRRGAEAYEAILRRRLARGEAISGALKDKKPDPKKRLYRDYIPEWFKTHVETNNRSSEQKKKRLLLNKHILPFFGNMQIGKIDTLSIEQYKSLKLKAGLSPKTIVNHLTILRKSLSDAKDWGYLEKIPVVKWPKRSETKINSLSEEEAEALLSYDQEPIWQLMILLGLRTGMRIGEMLALHWGDVDFKNGSICIRYSYSDKEITAPKNNRIRYVYMSPDLISALDCWKKRTESSKKKLVFDKNGKPYNRYSTYDAIKRICKRTSVRHIGWHALRHAFASELCAKGTPLPAVKTLMGHADISTTQRYIHINDEMLKRAAAVLGNQFATFGHYTGTTQMQVLVGA